MHQIKAYETSVSLFSRDGAVWVYPSIKAALKALGLRWISQNVGREFRLFYCTTWLYDERRNAQYERCYEERAYIMRDDFGGQLTAKDFEPWVARRRRLRGHYTWNGDGPVPGTRCSRGGGSYFRCMRTTAERRAAALVLREEGEVAPRAARNATNLPDAWDDWLKASVEARNWKRFRKTQWKA